jgi:hypothetical protein
MLGGAAQSQVPTDNIAAGNQAYKSKDYKKAEQYYQAATQQDPQSAKAFEGMGDCEFMLGNKAEALKDFERSLALDPSNNPLSQYIQTLKNQSTQADTAGQGKQASSDTVSKKGETANSDDEDGEDQPFKPYWENEFQLSYASQQAGQLTTSLCYTGTHHFTEGGNFLSLEGVIQAQKIEGVRSNVDILTLEGGLGIGSFTPSLSLGYELGQNDWQQMDSTLTLGFQVMDPLTINYTLGGTIGHHSGNVTGYFSTAIQAIIAPQGQAVTGQIDTATVNTSLGFTVVPWDWWSITPTLGYEYDLTYQVQWPRLKEPINQADKTATLSLALDFTLFKGFILDLSPQVGQEYQPAGTFYSKLAGGFVSSTVPTTQNFTGGTVSVSYSFE